MRVLNLFDSGSIAANSKREQFLKEAKEAEEYRLRRHIAAIQKSAKVEKMINPVSRRQYEIPSETNHLINEGRSALFMRGRIGL